MNGITPTAAQGNSRMTTYTIDTENSITAHASKQEAGESESFSSQRELANLVADWPAARLGGCPDLESAPTDSCERGFRHASEPS
jgi:hypothetical protein